MGSVNSTSASRSTASDFERRKTLAAERMYRNHYSSSSSGEFKPTNLTFKQKLFKKQQDLLYSYHASDRKRASALHSLEADEGSEFDTPTKLAFSPTQTHKGLRNLVGENNCFLNATIQALWHIGPFRHQLQMLIAKKNSEKEVSNVESNCESRSILDALCNLFVQYQCTELSILPPTELRTTLSDLFSQFQLGEIADANETLEAILETIHSEHKPACSHSSHKCLAHTVFGGLLMEQATCSECSESSAPMLRSDYVHYVYAAELISLASASDNEEQKGAASHDLQASSQCTGSQNQKRFGKLLHECMGVSPRCCPTGDVRSQPLTPINGSSPAAPSVGMTACENYVKDFSASLLSKTKCNGKANVTLFALEPPMALAMSIGWTSTRESAANLKSFLSLMSYTIQLSDLFDLSLQSDYNDARDGLHNSNNSPADYGTWKDNDGDTIDGSVHSDQCSYPIEGEEMKSGYCSPSQHSYSPDEDGANTFPAPQRNDTISPSYVFRGFVCYYGLHYVSVFQDHSKEGGVHAQFLLFDDQKIRPLGTWEDVKKECLKSLYQPVLLLYELQDSKNQNLNSAVDKHDEKEKENEKEKEREKEKDDSRSLILRDPSLDKSDKFHITSIFTSSSPRKKDILLGNKSALRQMLEDADSASVIAKQRSDSSPPLPSTSLSSPTVSAVTSFTSLASFGGKKYSADNFNFILSPAVSKDVLFDFQRKESQDEREQKFEFEQKIAIDILPIRVYENRPLLSYVTLVYEIFNGKKLLGFEHGMDELGRVIFVNFPKHPGTGEDLPAEKCGQIFLMDQLVGLDDTSLINYTTTQVRETFIKYASDSKRQMVLLTVKSSNICNLWYQCPYCSAEICIDKKEEMEMRKLHNKNRSNIYDNMLTDRINNAKSGSCTEAYVSNSNVHALVCTCTNCKKICSSKDIFQYEQYM